MRRRFIVSMLVVIGLLPGGRALAEPPLGGIALDQSTSIWLGFDHSPQDLAVVDTDVDGRNDVVATVWSESDGPQLEIFRQSSGGVLSSAEFIDLTVDDPTIGRLTLAVADMDGDGDEDVALGAVDHIEIWSSTPAGLTWASSRALPDGVVDLWAVDADLDGRIDLLAGGFEPASGVAEATLLHRGAGGGFTLTTVYQGASTVVGFADTTGDGRPDVEVCCDAGTGVVKQKTDGTFLPFVPGPPTSWPASVGEFTGNDRADIVQWDWKQERWVILPGKADGTLGAPVLLPLDMYVSSVWKVADLNGDGLDDLVFNTGFWYGGMLVSYQRDDGSFTAGCDYRVGVEDSTTFDAMAVGDVNDDGRADILTAWDFLNVAHQTTSASVTLDITTPRTAYYVDEQVALDGSLGMDPLEGGCGRDQAIHLQRTGTGGTVDLGVVRTNWTGYWTFTEPAPLPVGTYTYEASWPGDELRDPVTDSFQVTVGMRTAGTELEVPGQVRYGHDARWSFVLYTDGDDDPLAVDVSTKSGGVEHPIGTFPVDPETSKASGVLTGLSENTTIILRWAGDDTYAPVEVSRKVGVSPILKDRMLRDDGMSREVHLYRADKRVFYGVTVEPNHAGSPIRIVIEHKVGTRWHEIVDQRFDLGRGSSLVVYLPARYLVVGDTYHINATFLADGDHAATKAPWSLFRIIRADREAARPSGAALLSPSPGSPRM